MGTRRIVLRLQEGNVAFLDAEIAAGRVVSRSAYVDDLLTHARLGKRSQEDMEKIQADLARFAQQLAAGPISDPPEEG